ncbi:MAG: hypothetical protein WCH30_01650 [Chlorobiaceae bacterium]
MSKIAIFSLAEALQEATIEERGRKLALRTASVGTCGKVFVAGTLKRSPIRTC